MIDLEAVRRAVAEANPLPSTDPIPPMQAEEIVSLIQRRVRVGSNDTAEATLPTDRARAREVRGSRWTPAIIVAAATFVVIATFAAPALLGYWLRSDADTPTDPPTIVTTTTTTVVTTTSIPASPPPSVPPVGLPITWTRVPHDPTFEDAAFADAAANDERIVVVGGSDIGEDGATMTGAVWVSDDGSTWTHIQDPSFAENFDDEPPPWWTAGMSAVAYDQGVFVAVGHVGNDAAVWASTDGLEWPRIDAPSLGGEGLESILGVTSGTSGWVAVGQEDLNAGVWFSADGASWEAVDDSDLRAGGDIVSALLFDVVEGGPGYVAVGWIQVKGARTSVNGGSVGNVEQAAVWVSVDGRDWTLTDLDQFGDEYIIASVVVDPEDDSLIGFGWNGMWRSTDGAQWSLSDNRDSEWTSLPPPGASIAWYEEGAVAAAQDSALALWTSADHGTTWARHDPEDPAFEGHRPAVWKVLTLKNRVLALGATGEYLSEVNAMWIGSIDADG